MSGAKKVHLHDEQLDGALHAACRKMSRPAGSPEIVGDEDFEATPAHLRCKVCAIHYWPYAEPL